MKKLHIPWLVISVHLLILQLFAEQPGPLQPAQSDFAANECLIKFKPGTDGTVIDSICYNSKLTLLSYYPYGRFYRVRTPVDQDDTTFIKTLAQSPSIDQVQPDYYITSFNYTADTLPPLQWNSGNISSVRVNLPATRDTAAVSDNVVVAIIGSGSAFETYQNSKKARALNDTRFVNGFNALTFDEHANDDNGNGTLTATIISNLYKNISDSTLPASRTSIMPVKITDKKGIGRTSDLIEGILFAVNNGADILTVNTGSADSPLLRQAIVQAFNRGVTIICASGNASDPHSHYYPAAYNQYCIAVTTIGCNDSQGVSVPHSDYIDLSASGEILYHNVDPSGYTTARGTSIAAAQVTATVVLLKILGIDGSDRIRQILEQSCIDTPPRGWDWQSGWGMLDAHKTIQLLPKPDHDLKIAGFRVSPWCIKGELLQTIANVKNQGTFEHELSVTLSDVQTNRVLATVTGSLKPQQSSQFILEWNTSHEVNGTHLLSVSVNISGDEDPADNIQYKKVLVTEDKRDVEISGVEFKKQPEKNSFLTMVQVKNSGTYNEILHVKVQEHSGTTIGWSDTQICAQCIMYVPVRCQLDSTTSLKELDILIETADLQESNMANNKVTCPFTISE